MSCADDRPALIRLGSFFGVLDVPLRWVSPHAMRRRTLGLFVLIGTAIAFIGSWGASAGLEAALAIGPALVFFSVMAGAAFCLDRLLGTLLAVVAVVAVGFPHPPSTAQRRR